MEREERYQAFRSNQGDRVVWIEAFYHKKTRQHVIYWKDILDAFPKVKNIMKGPAVVPRARDSAGQDIKPRCIKYHHDLALDVTLGDVFSSGADVTLSISRAATPDMFTESPASPAPTSSLAFGHNSLTWTSQEQQWCRHTTSCHTRLVPNTHSISNADSISVAAVCTSKAGRRSTSHGTKRPAAATKTTAPVEEQQEKETFLASKATECEISSDVSSASSRIVSSSEGSRTNFSKEDLDEFNADDLTEGSPLSRNRDHLILEDDSLSWLSQRRISSAEMPIITTNVAQANDSDASMQSIQLMKRLQSVVLSFEQFMAKGQLDYANALRQESESIKQEMSQNQVAILAAISKNTKSQNQTLEDAEMAIKQVIELQEEQRQFEDRMLLLQKESLLLQQQSLLLQQETLDRLALIQRKAAAILIQDYELNECPIPRLFIILPKGHNIHTNLSAKHFRLYFLCECGDHTRPVDDAQSALSHNIHLAHHGGYDLGQPKEFFRKYGPYMLALLQMLKYGVTVAGIAVPPLSTLEIADESAIVEAGLNTVTTGFVHRVDLAIKYLQGLTTGDAGDDSLESNLEALEGTDIRQLRMFLKKNHAEESPGNLYRTVTPEGHVKWVCLEHYAESYGTAALQKFKETVELSGGKYDEQAGRVIIRLASSILAKQFYTMLLSTRVVVHELELTLDWNTSFEDLRILKGVIQQSNVYHLGLNLCGKTGPTSDFVYRNRRAEPIVQLMASGKIRSMNLRDTTGFLSQTKSLLKSTLHVRHMDLSDRIGNVDDFNKLEKLIHASPMLTRLGVVVEDVDQAFERLKPLVARHNTLSILDLQLQDGTAASVQFEHGSDKISKIGLKVIEPSTFNWMRMPMVTSVEFLAKNSFSRSADLVHAAVKELKCLETVKVMQLPDGGSVVLQNMQRAIQDYYSDKNGTQDVEQGGGVAISPETIEARSRFMALESLHKQSVLHGMELMVATAEGLESGSETTEDISGTFGKSAIDIHGTGSVFTSRRQDGSLAMVNFEPDENGSNSAILHVGDFDMSRIFHHSSVTRLMLVGQQSAKLFAEMIQAPSTTGGFCNLRTVEFDSEPEDILSLLQMVQLARAQCPALSKLHLWNASHNFNEESRVSPNRVLITYDILLKKMDFGDYFASQEEISSLLQRFHSSPLVSKLAMTFPAGELTNSLLEMGEGEEVLAGRHIGATMDGEAKRSVMQWMMSTSITAIPESAYASSVFSEETADIHFQWLKLPTESEADAMDEYKEDELVLRRVYSIPPPPQSGYY
ncbi:hypothetical protein BGW39_003835 [Mortierella sp. 14UC]|nr:hypothetical protein BGW39_003835 [Mortierella sp. 14UC]